MAICGTSDCKIFIGQIKSCKIACSNFKKDKKNPPLLDYCWTVFLGACSCDGLCGLDRQKSRVKARKEIYGLRRPLST